MIGNKDHWYDGWFYDKIIAPNQDTLFGQIEKIIEKNRNIIDIGTGTGRFPFMAAHKCNQILGIDLSKRNIDRAEFLHSKNPDNKIKFRHCKLSELISEGNEHFDYAVLTYVIHEVDEDERITLLKEISIIADIIIIGDYLVPKPKGFWSVLNEIVEFLAGPSHFKNYKNYVANGGINYLAEKAGLKIVNDIKNIPYTSHLVLLEKN